MRRVATRHATAKKGVLYVVGVLHLSLRRLEMTSLDADWKQG